MSKFNISIIGVGKRGKTFLKELEALENVRLVACCDIIKPSFKIGIPFYLSYKEMLSRHPEINGVIVATPAASHYKIAKDLLKSKKHILIEKPFVLSVKQSNELIAIARQKELSCVVGYHIRYNNLVKKLADIVKSGSLGKITMVRSRQSHNWGGNKPTNWHVSKRISGGGTLIDNASHYLDLMTTIFGKVKNVYATSNNHGYKQKVEDNALIVLKLKSGVIAFVESSWSDGSGRKNLVNVWGTGGALEFVENNLGVSLEQKSYSPDRDGWNKSVSQFYYIPKGVEKNKYTKVSENNPVKNMIEFFINISTSNIKQRLYYRLNNPTYTVKLIRAAYKSLYENKVVSKI